MENLLNFTRLELANWLEKKGIRPFRAGQVFKWVYLKDTDQFEQMTDVGKEMRAMLNSAFVISRLELESSQKSADTTEKFLFRLEDGQHIESVLIPERDHYTLCVSSQVGCARNCRFCLTAKGKLRRNLEVSEIVSQVRDIRHILESRSEAEGKRLSNIVFMGMGEPLDNYGNLLKSLEIILDTDFGLKFSARRVTVSTCGLIPEITRLGEDTEVNLAISLNATDNETRSRLMPVNNRYPLEDLLEACRTFSMKPRNKITFEYILIKGINDTPEDAHRLVKLLRPIKAKVNLIPFNEHPESEFKRPDSNVIQRFLQILLDKKMTAIIRKSKGDDILAACGQLRAKLINTS
ncbi:MAG: 23S rRNA (adenine(2503)-C(2))-methyltransferase RlmN [Desulfobacteraceae bacterium]|nr:MAG: 23S rRNA (adenine(2503)-C(2))-methyltransferase RlmN [Desulfobacteraceae bacterium]